MKKLCLLFLVLILVVGCGDSQEKQIFQKHSFQQLHPNFIRNSPLKDKSNKPCDCNGGVYLPASLEIMAFD